MLTRTHPAWFYCGGSAIVLAVLIGLLWLLARGPRSLVIYCAASLRPAVETIAQEYEDTHGRAVEIRYGASQSLLANLELTREGDLFLPADELYMEQARSRGLVAEVFPLARISAVLILRPGYPDPAPTWPQLLEGGMSLAQANPDAAAIGLLTRAHLERTGQWTLLARRTTVFVGNVSDVANAVRLGSVDAGIVWDAVAAQHPDLKVVHLTELEGIEALVPVGILTSSASPVEARQFTELLRSPASRRRLDKLGYRCVEEP